MFNPFHATGLFLHPLKTSENLSSINFGEMELFRRYSGENPRDLLKKKSQKS